MKPQCETAAACLRELARVMEQFGIISVTSAVQSIYVKYCGGKVYGVCNDITPAFSTPSDWQFAIAEVEGKPVFVGDELWHKDYGLIVIENGCGYLWELYSWNQPKPKTVLVELTVDQAELGAKLGLTTDIAQACRKALEKQ